jgi:hypothetical protein
MPTQAELARAELARRELARRQAPAQRAAPQPQRRTIPTSSPRNLTEMVSGRTTDYVDPRLRAELAGGRGDFSGNVASGITLGLSPLVIGGMMSYKGVPDAFRQRSLAPIRQAYEQHRDADRQSNANTIANNPVLGIGSEIVGGLMLARAGPVALAGAPRLASVLGRASRAIAPVEGALPASVGAVTRATARAGVRGVQGAALGGTYAVGQGGNVGDQALLGGAINVVAGPIVGGVMRKGLQAVDAAAVRVAPQTAIGRSAAARISARNLDVATRDIMRQFRSTGVTEAQVRDELTRLHRIGVSNPTYFDVARNLNAQGVIANGRAVARSGAQPRAIATQYSGNVRNNTGTDLATASSGAARLQGSKAGTTARLQAQRATIAATAMAPIRASRVRVPVPAAETIRAGRVAPLARDLEVGLRSRAASSQRPQLAQEADSLAALRAGEQDGVTVRAPAFDPRQSQAYADNLDVAMSSLDPMPTMPGKPPLPQAVILAGGIRDRAPDLGRAGAFGRARVGEIEGVLGSSNRLPGVINNKSGLDPTDMAENLRQSGMLGQARMPVNEWEANAAEMSGIHGNTDDMVAMLREYVEDPARFRYGRDDEFMAKYDDWLSRIHNAEQMGLGASTQKQARGMALERTYNEYTPAGPERFDEFPSYPAPQTPDLALDTIERLRDKISEAEQIALGKGEKSLHDDLADARHAIVNPAREQYPAYGDMLDELSALHRQESALNAGSVKDLNLNPDEFSRKIGAFSGPERLRYAQGLAQSLSDRFAPITGGGAMSAEPLGSNPRLLENLGSAFGAPHADRYAGQVKTYIDRAREAAQINPNYGSQTTNNLSGAEGLEQFGDALGAVPSTKIGAARTAMTIASRLVNFRSAGEREAYMRLLLETTPDSSVRAIAARYLGLSAPQTMRTNAIAQNLGMIPIRAPQDQSAY